MLTYARGYGPRFEIETITARTSPCSSGAHESPHQPGVIQIVGIFAAAENRSIQPAPAAKLQSKMYGQGKPPGDSWQKISLPSWQRAEPMFEACRLRYPPNVSPIPSARPEYIPSVRPVPATITVPAKH